MGESPGARQGAGDRGHRLSPLPAPCAEGTETPPAPPKREGTVSRTLPARHANALTAALAKGFSSGLLLPRGAAPGGGGGVSGQQA